jgi:peroxiredoxin
MGLLPVFRMALTPSTMLPLGTVAPDFELPDVVTGKKVGLKTFPHSKAYLVMFLCNHCPYVKHVRDAVAGLARDYTPRGVAVVGISSNDVVKYPADSPEKMVEEARAGGYQFPYLYDATQEVAKAYRAACTPDFFLFDAQQRLVYRGQMDGSRPGNGLPVDGLDLRRAIDSVLSGQPVAGVQRPSMGCNIKWKAGNAPDYFGVGAS